MVHTAESVLRLSFVVLSRRRFGLGPVVHWHTPSKLNDASVHTQRIMASEEFEGLSVEGLELCRPEVIRRILAAAKESTNFDSSDSIGRWKQKFKIRNLLHRREAVWVLIYVINHGHSRPPPQTLLWHHDARTRRLCFESVTPCRSFCRCLSLRQPLFQA